MLIIIALTSCTKLSPLKQYIHDADKVEVTLYKGDKPYAQDITTDIDKIKEWMNYISDSTTSAPSDCIMDGKLKFVQYQDSLQLTFGTSNGCTQVHYTINGKDYVQPITADGMAYINNLKKVSF